MTAIIGPNGAGKSTLLKAIAGTLKAREGRIILGGLNRRQLGYLPQQADIDRSFPINTWDTVMLGLWNEVGVMGGVSKAQTERICNAIAVVGLSAFEHRPIGTLSVGQLQRILFARLLVQDPQVILLDEPFAAVDERTRDDLMKLVHRWHAEGRTVVAALHELDQVRLHFPNCLMLSRQLISWGPTPEVLTEQNLAAARRLSLGWRDHISHGDHYHAH
jgi:zinc/manganese transport system ATP-binding protein